MKNRVTTPTYLLFHSKRNNPIKIKQIAYLVLTFNSESDCKQNSAFT